MSLSSSRPVSPHYIPGLSFNAIRQAVEVNPALILPTGCCEPFGSNVPIGASLAVVNSIAHRLSLRANTLLADTFTYGMAIAYQAFPGCAGLKADCLENALSQIIGCWIYQGMRRIILIDGSVLQTGVIQAVRKRIAARYESVDLLLLNWQQHPAILKRISQQIKAKEAWRQEWAMLSIYMHLTGSAFENSREARPSGEHMKSWQRRGKDPAGLRKIMPHGLSGSVAVSYDASFGKALFEYILHVFAAETEHFFQGKHA
ncbi:MAG: hypothetical protein GF398_13030 [Chitinivibrionales bacterium]|nr:hypothetical protein [Chitinivibrionales bacterium]